MIRASAKSDQPDLFEVLSVGHAPQKYPLQYILSTCMGPYGSRDLSQGQWCLCMAKVNSQNSATDCLLQ